MLALRAHVPSIFLSVAAAGAIFAVDLLLRDVAVSVAYVVIVLGSRRAAWPAAALLAAALATILSAAAHLIAAGDAPLDGVTERLLILGVVWTVAVALTRQNGAPAGQRTAERSSANMPAPSDAEPALQDRDMAVLGRLSRGIIHDLNNLLTVIGGNVELAEQRIAENSTAAARLAKARRAVFEGRELTDQVLALGRRWPASPQQTDPDRLIRRTCGLFQRSFESHAPLDILLDPGLWCCWVDPPACRMMLLAVLAQMREGMQGDDPILVRANNLAVRSGEPPPVPDLAAGNYVVVWVSGDGGRLSDITRLGPLWNGPDGALAVESGPGLGIRVGLYLPSAIPAAPETRG